jgi:hypothetical protein
MLGNISCWTGQATGLEHPLHLPLSHGLATFPNFAGFSRRAPMHLSYGAAYSFLLLVSLWWARFRTESHPRHRKSRINHFRRDREVFKACHPSRTLTFGHTADTGPSIPSGFPLYLMFQVRKLTPLTFRCQRSEE